MVRAGSGLIESRAQVVEAADRERKRIERNLHDGAQKRLISSLLLLRRMSLDGGIPPAVREPSTSPPRRPVERSRSFAGSCGGIHPVALTGSGLAAALRGLAERCPVDVDVDVPELRLREPTRSRSTTARPSRWPTSQRRGGDERRRRPSRRTPASPSCG